MPRARPATRTDSPSNGPWLAWHEDGFDAAAARLRTRARNEFGVQALLPLPPPGGPVPPRGPPPPIVDQWAVSRPWRPRARGHAPRGSRARRRAPGRRRPDPLRRASPPGPGSNPTSPPAREARAHPSRRRRTRQGVRRARRRPHLPHYVPQMTKAQPHDGDKVTVEARYSGAHAARRGVVPAPMTPGAASSGAPRPATITAGSRFTRTRTARG